MTEPARFLAPARRGIYVHIPFCARKCHYCDFNSYALDRAAVRSFLRALDAEIALYAREAGDEPFDTLSLGGGTPTCLSGRDLSGLVRRITAAFPFREDAEITCEANPGSSNAEKFAALREAGVNRLSLGAQSFDDGLLRALGRDHSAGDVVESVRAAREAGFDNLNLDLMFALPGQSLAQWEATLEAALELRPEHLSCYSLIIEEGTPFGELHARGKLSLPGEETERAMFDAARVRLAAAGYVHYEISNFAFPGRESRHNQLYWRIEPYLGLGPGAHGHWNGVRYANVRLPSDYAALVEAGKKPVEESRPVPLEEEMEDVLVFGMRLLGGVERGRFRERFGIDVLEAYPREVERLRAKGLLEVTEEVVRLTREAVPVANQVFVEFLRSR